MKRYAITVNGVTYDVTVDEITDGAAPVAAPAAAPAPKRAAAPAPAAPAAGSIEVKAGAAGKVVNIVAKPGDVLKAGDHIMVLEIMKMETPVVAPEDGTVVSIVASKDQQVAAGELLATLN